MNLSETLFALTRKHSEKTGKTEVEIRREIAQLIYPEQNKDQRSINSLNLFNGKRKNTTMEMIDVICQYFGVTPSEFYGYENNEGEAVKKLAEIKRILG